MDDSAETVLSAYRKAPIWSRSRVSGSTRSVYRSQKGYRPLTCDDVGQVQAAVGYSLMIPPSTRRRRSGVEYRLVTLACGGRHITQWCDSDTLCTLARGGPTVISVATR